MTGTATITGYIRQIQITLPLALRNHFDSVITVYFETPSAAIGPLNRAFF